MLGAEIVGHIDVVIGLRRDGGAALRAGARGDQRGTGDAEIDRIAGSARLFVAAVINARPRGAPVTALDQLTEPLTLLRLTPPELGKSRYSIAGNRWRAGASGDR